jgi:hypothetical protein
MNKRKWMSAAVAVAVLTLFGLLAGRAAADPTDTVTTDPVSTVTESPSAVETVPEVVVPEAGRQIAEVPAPGPGPDPRVQQEVQPSCDPNYSGCVPIASDVDCEGGDGDGPAYVEGPITVIGEDIYDLDANGDGTACEGDGTSTTTTTSVPVATTTTTDAPAPATVVAEAGSGVTPVAEENLAYTGTSSAVGWLLLSGVGAVLIGGAMLLIMRMRRKLPTVGEHVNRDRDL